MIILEQLNYLPLEVKLKYIKNVYVQNYGENSGFADWFLTTEGRSFAGGFVFYESPEGGEYWEDWFDHLQENLDRLDKLEKLALQN